MKLRNKLFLANFFVTLMVFFLLGLIIINFVENYNLHGVYKQLLTQKEFAQSYVDQYLGVRNDAKSYIKIYHKELERILSSQVGHVVDILFEENPKLEGGHTAAMEGKTAYYINTKGEEHIFYLAFPVKFGGEILASAQYSYSLEQQKQMKADLVTIFIVSFLLMTMVIFAVSYGFVYHLIKPLEKLRESMLAFSKGEFTEIRDINSGDEIQELSYLFNDMAQDVQATIKELKDEQQKQKRFLDSITHEIRTPLTNIIGFTDLNNRVNMIEDKIRYGKYVEEEGQRLLKMLDDLLNLSKLKQVEYTISKEETNLKDLIQYVVEVLGTRIKRYGYSLDMELHGVCAEVDQDKIKQVLINLVDNSLKYSQGNKITIRLFKKDSIIIQVEDNGVGINKVDLSRIFEPFYRVDQFRSRKLGGIGLGLTICKEIVEKHRGKINIESEPGQGTIVTISILP